MTATPVPRIDDVDRFHDEFFVTGRPVVVTGAARRMPAFERWTDAYLLETLGEVRPLITLADGRRGTMRIADYLAYLASPERFHSSTGAVYLTDLYIRPRFLGAQLDRLAPDARCPLPRGGAPLAERTTLYAGPRGTASEMHQDVFETQFWVAQLRGEKAVRLCAPDALDRATAATVDAFRDDDLGCEVLETVVRAGDVLYLPASWWHQVRNESATLAIYGHFSTYAHARSAMAATHAIADRDFRESWLSLWAAILALEAEPS